MKGFTDIIRRYATDNRYCGELSDADGTGEIGLGADKAGRQIAVRFTLQVHQGRVTDLRYQVFGCGYSIAACAAAAELAIDTPLEEICAIDSQAVDSRLAGLPEDRRYCADLAARALQAAVENTRHETQALQEVYVPPADDHKPRVNNADPLYRSLMDSPAKAGIAEEDRHLFACLLTVAGWEPYDTAMALGLQEDEKIALQQQFFPDWDADSWASLIVPETKPFPEINTDVQELLRSHSGPDNDSSPASLWLVKVLAARAALPGHLWVAMGLFERPQLSAAIRRHLPKLFAANDKNMRWKRFFFKQVCDMNGGTLCKTPNCGECSDYALCFAGDD